MGARVNIIQPTQQPDILRLDPDFLTGLPQGGRLWRELTRSQLEPSAVDLLPGRVALLFEGTRSAVDAQAAACPGDPAGAEVWEESARLQAGAAARVPFDWQECRLARPGPGIAFVASPPEPRDWSPLAERVRASFDPEGQLA